MDTLWQMPHPPDQEYRRRRLDALAHHPDFNSRAALGRALGYRDGAFVRQMIAGERPISEKTIAAVETLRGGKFRGWFDHGPLVASEPPPPGDFTRRAPPSQSEWAVLEDLRVLPQNERQALLADVHTRAEVYRAYTREVLARVAKKERS